MMNKEDMLKAVKASLHVTPEMVKEACNRIFPCVSGDSDTQALFNQAGYELPERLPGSDPDVVKEWAAAVSRRLAAIEAIHQLIHAGQLLPVGSSWDAVQEMKVHYGAGTGEWLHIQFRLPVPFNVTLAPSLRYRQPGA